MKALLSYDVEFFLALFVSMFLQIIFTIMELKSIIIKIKFHKSLVFYIGSIEAISSGLSFEIFHKYITFIRV